MIVRFYIYCLYLKLNIQPSKYIQIRMVLKKILPSLRLV